MFEEEKEESKRIEESLPFFYWLLRIPELGYSNKTLFSLMRCVNSPEEIFYLHPREVDSLTEQGLLQESMGEKLKEALGKEEPYAAFAAMKERGITMLPFYHPLFPEKLRCIPDPPAALFYMGKMPEENKKSVAIIGARDCSLYGERVAAMFAKSFAREGVQVISGMARGIDGIGQRVTLDSGGTSFAVLGSGVDVCYPRQNKFLYDALQTQGGILSTFLPGTMAMARNFPIRNRIISGLSDACLVVEAREQSGTKITVDTALDQGREVFVVPGRIDDVLSEGCNELIKQGANMANNPEDILAFLFDREQSTEKKQGQRKKKKSFENPVTAAVYGCLSTQPQSVDEILNAVSSKLKMHLTPGTIMQELIRLSVEGEADRVEGGFVLL